MLGSFFHMTSGYVSGSTMKGSLGFVPWLIHNNHLLCPQNMNWKTQMMRGSMVPITPLDLGFLSIGTPAFESLTSLLSPFLLECYSSELCRYPPCIPSISNSVDSLCSSRLHEYFHFSCQIFRSSNSWIS
jgi:hypothetical protein